MPRLKFNDRTQEGRGEHWTFWLLAPSHQKNLIGTPPCYTCGERPIGTFPDGSPRFWNCHGQKPGPGAKQRQKGDLA